jgi:two-component system NarL family response regulator
MWPQEISACSRFLMLVRSINALHVTAWQPGGICLSRTDSEPSPSIRVLIIDDHLVVRAGFNSILHGRAGLRVIGSVQSGEEALKWLGHSEVDIILLDIRMPGMGGLNTLLELQKLPSVPKVIILSSLEPDEQVCRAVEAGANGYLLKDSPHDTIIEAVHAVHSGRSYLPEWVVSRLSERKLRTRLSERELEILEMVSKGLTNKEIGRAIQVSHLTVRNHVRHIIEKLDVSDRTEAATLAIQQGILFACG